MRWIHWLLAGLLLLLMQASFAWALDREEVIALTRAGVAPAVIVAQLEATGVARPPAAADLLALHEAGVADEVVRAMIRLGRAVGPETGTFRLTNEDFDRVCVLVQPEKKTYILYAGNSQINPTLQRDESREFVLPPGDVRLLWMGEQDGVTVRVQPGRTVHVMMRHLTLDLVRVLYADVYDGDRFVESKPLRVFPRFYRPRPSAAGVDARDPRTENGAAPPPGATGPAPTPTTESARPYRSEGVSGYAEK